MVFTAEEMKEKVCKTFSMVYGCSISSNCNSCWLSGGGMCTGWATCTWRAADRIKHQAILRAILEDKIVWHEGEMCLVVEDYDCAE